MSFPLRENSFTRDVPSTTLTPRWPSHFHSHTQAGPDGSGPGVASIGDNGFGGIDDGCPRRGSANHRKPTAGGRTSPPGPPHMGHQFLSYESPESDMPGTPSNQPTVARSLFGVDRPPSSCRSGTSHPNLWKVSLP